MLRAYQQSDGIALEAGRNDIAAEILPRAIEAWDRHYYCESRFGRLDEAEGAVISWFRSSNFLDGAQLHIAGDVGRHIADSSFE